MSDNKEINSRQDRERININERYELEQWSSKFGCSTEELKLAITKVGPMASAVADELRKRK